MPPLANRLPAEKRLPAFDGARDKGTGQPELYSFKAKDLPLRDALEQHVNHLPALAHPSTLPDGGPVPGLREGLARCLRASLAQVRDALRATADNTAMPDNSRGWGLIDAFEAVGAAATPDTPLGWIALETDPATFRHELRVRLWDGDAHQGEEHLLSHAHPHGAWVEWLAD